MKIPKNELFPYNDKPRHPCASGEDEEYVKAFNCWYHDISISFIETGLTGGLYAKASEGFRRKRSTWIPDEHCICLGRNFWRLLCVGFLVASGRITRSRKPLGHDLWFCSKCQWMVMRFFCFPSLLPLLLITPGFGMATGMDRLSDHGTGWRRWRSWVAVEWSCVGFPS